MTFMYYLIYCGEKPYAVEVPHFTDKKAKA